MVEGLPEDAVFNRPLTVRIREACRLTGIGRSKLYELIAAGEIEVVKVGAITLVPVSSLTSFLRRKAADL
jgi:excisionase family DNA binding protein